MVEVGLFQYRSGDSFLHRLDVRIKLLCLVLLSITCLYLQLGAVVVLLLAIAALHLGCRFSIARTARSLRPFLWILLLIVLARSFTAPQEPAAASNGMQFYTRGLLDGLLVSLRLLCVVVLSSLFTSSTTVFRLKAAVEWVFRPVPFVAESGLASMVGLAVSFIPLIAAETGRITMAQKARCIENRHNPISRLTALGLAVTRRAFDRADAVVWAMEARCYTGQMTPASMTFRTGDWFAVGAVGAVCAALLLVGR